MVPSGGAHARGRVPVPAEQTRELAELASRDGIPFVRRDDLWSFILEEFLDTGLPPDLREGALRYLESKGVSRAETRAMRELVKNRMMALTYATWEWRHYGLYDVLSAMSDPGGIPVVLFQPGGVRKCPSRLSAWA